MNKNILTYKIQMNKILQNQKRKIILTIIILPILIFLNSRILIFKELKDIKIYNNTVDTIWYSFNKIRAYKWLNNKFILLYGESEQSINNNKYPYNIRDFHILWKSSWYHPQNYKFFDRYNLNIWKYKIIFRMNNKIKRLDYNLNYFQDKKNIYLAPISIFVNKENLSKIKKNNSYVKIILN